MVLDGRRPSSMSTDSEDDHICDRLNDSTMRIFVLIFALGLAAAGGKASRSYDQ